MGAKNAHLTEFGEVNLERLCIIFKPERNHRVEYILATNRLALLELALLCSFGRDEADKF